MGFPATNELFSGELSGGGVIFILACERACMSAATAVGGKERASNDSFLSREAEEGSGAHIMRPNNQHIFRQVARISLHYG